RRNNPVWTGLATPCQGTRSSAWEPHAFGTATRSYALSFRRTENSWRPQATTPSSASGRPTPARNSTAALDTRDIPFRSPFHLTGGIVPPADRTTLFAFGAPRQVRNSGSGSATSRFGPLRIPPMGKRLHRAALANSSSGTWLQGRKGAHFVIGQAIPWLF